MPQPLITFIICTYNRADYLRDSLYSLLQTDVSPDEFELLVVDNNSTDQTSAVFKNAVSGNASFQLRYVKEISQGLSHARNRGVEEARSEYIVFLDDDINASKELISEWLSFIDARPDAAAAGGKIHVQFDDPRPVWMSHFLLPLLGYHDLGDKPKEYPKNKYPFGGNMGFEKSIFDDVGLFNTDLGRKGTSLGAAEEKELFRRIRQTGEKIYYLPDAFLHHRVNADRLTINYIRKQALGLGQSMNRQLEGASSSKKIINGLSECFKLLASIPLALGYLLTGKLAKAKMLFRFRKWIWEGYRN